MSDQEPTEMEDAWIIIHVLMQHLMDDGEPSWPRALQWLERNMEHSPKR